MTKGKSDPLATGKKSTLYVHQKGKSGRSKIPHMHLLEELGFNSEPKKHIGLEAKKRKQKKIKKNFRCDARGVCTELGHVIQR